MAEPAAVNIDPLAGGSEWIVEAYGCDAVKLQDCARAERLFTEMIEQLALNPVAPAQWHLFPGEGGLTGLVLLSESHIACHTFPEFGSLCLNLFCCRPRPRWDFEQALQQLFGAETVRVREVSRPYHV